MANRKKRLLLVYPEISSSNTNTATYSVPLGLGSIGTYCKQKMRDLDVKILDGSQMTYNEQLKELAKFRPDVTGINSTIASQENAYKIAELAKECGSLVIFGGVHSTNLYRSMLKNRDFIDGVILYEGEIPMYEVLNSIRKHRLEFCFFSPSMRGMPNLAFKMYSEKSIYEPRHIYIPKLEDLPDIDYSLFDLDRFFKQTQKRGFGKAITYYAGKGCSKRGHVELKNKYRLSEYNSLVDSMDVCTFCGRNELGFRNLDESREAKVVRDLHSKYGVTGFFNVQDTVNLGNTTPIGLEDSWFRLFIGAEKITLENIHRLKQRYGPNLIFQTGIEAANPKMRQVYGKTATDSDDIEAKAELMRKEGVQLHASFILGGRGETEQSMHETTKVARKLAGYSNATWILISPQIILPGSPDYRALLQMPKMKRKYADQDLIDIAEINRDFLKYFTPDLTREQIVEEIKNTFADIVKSNGKVVLDVKGVKKDEEAYISPNRPYTEEKK